MAGSGRRHSRGPPRALGSRLVPTLRAAGTQSPSGVDVSWKPASTAPFDRDIEIAVIDADGTHALVFPCRRVLGGWMNARSKALLAPLLPTHWREWGAR